MLAAVSFIMIIVMVVLLTKFKWLPAVVFTTLPIVVALALGIGAEQTLALAAGGISKVLPVAAMFIGSITYFGIMGDVGLFDGFIDFLLSKLKNNITSMLVVTACVALITHLDGSGTTTLMITVPALLPIAERMGIRKQAFAIICSMSISCFNILPWGGPLGRVGTVLGGLDPVAIWIRSLPMMIFSIVLLFGLCFFVSWDEKRKGFFNPGNGTAGTASRMVVSEEALALKRPKLVWVNLLLTLGVLALLFLGVPSFLPFLMGTGLALLINYGKDGSKAQTARLKAHAPNILPLVFTIICAGIFLGIFSGSGMVEAMAEVIIGLIPTSLGRFVHIIMGILSIPLSLVFDADTKIFGFLPVLIEVAESCGIDPVKAGIAIAYGHNFGVNMCMTSASVYFGLGLYGLEYGEALRYNWLKMLGVGTLVILFGAVVGIL